jgi:hypothetical protein
MKNWILLLLPITVFSWITPWIAMPIITMIWAIFTEGKVLHKVLISFGLVYLYWIIYAGVLDFQNKQILSTRMAQLFSINPPILLLVSTGLLGGITAGLAAWSGALIRSFVYKGQNN